MTEENSLNMFKIEAIEKELEIHKIPRIFRDGTKYYFFPAIEQKSGKSRLLSSLAKTDNNYLDTEIWHFKHKFPESSYFQRSDKIRSFDDMKKAFPHKEEMIKSLSNDINYLEGVNSRIDYLIKHFSIYITDSDLHYLTHTLKDLSSSVLSAANHFWLLYSDDEDRINFQQTYTKLLQLEGRPHTLEWKENDPLGEGMQYYLFSSFRHKSIHPESNVNIQAELLNNIYPFLTLEINEEFFDHDNPIFQKDFEFIKEELLENASPLKSDIDSKIIQVEEIILNAKAKKQNINPYWINQLDMLKMQSSNSEFPINDEFLYFPRQPSSDNNITWMVLAEKTSETSISIKKVLAEGTFQQWSYMFQSFVWKVGSNVIKELDQNFKIEQYIKHLIRCTKDVREGKDLKKSWDESIDQMILSERFKRKSGAYLTFLTLLQENRIGGIANSEFTSNDPKFDDYKIQSAKTLELIQKNKINEIHMKPIELWQELRKELDLQIDYDDQTFIVYCLNSLRMIKDPTRVKEILPVDLFENIEIEAS
ncbi:MAG: hypothetical protein HeimC3_16230 [Candidatus Heimdallarchaeota archaeon LC_3]|nr:MAG: hypothetical protein HeimC3_16230 [Candidatus Heimdallarchaeota archaeon LC_3]